jgi:hypothetical protein
LMFDQFSGNEVTHHLLEVAYSFDKALEYAKPKYYLCSRCKGCFIFMSV